MEGWTPNDHVPTRGERDCEKAFKKFGVKYESEATFPGFTTPKGNPYRFDFRIEYLKVLVEYQGEQHYHPVEEFGGSAAFLKQQQADRAKRMFAAMNGYRLIEVPYWYNNSYAVESFLRKELSRAAEG